MFRYCLYILRLFFYVLIYSGGLEPNLEKHTLAAFPINRVVSVEIGKDPDACSDSIYEYERTSVGISFMEMASRDGWVVEMISLCV